MSTIDTEIITKKQKSVLGAIALVGSIIVAAQSYGILPYQMTEVRKRLEQVEKDRRTDRDLAVSLEAQLKATREEMVDLRNDLRAFSADVARKSNAVIR